MLDLPTLPEAEIVRRVAAETHLLELGTGIRLRLVHASEFTRAVALRLKARGWGLLYKTVGLNVDMISIDSIVHRDTGDVAVIIVDAGQADARPSWQIRPANCAACYIDPEVPDAMRMVLSRQEISLIDIARGVTRINELLTSRLPGGRFTNGAPVPDRSSDN